MKSKFNWKDFIIYGFTFSIILIILSGIIIYISPNSEFARSSNWQIFGFSKLIWRSIFISFILTFIGLAIIYVFIAEKDFFKNYFNKKRLENLSDNKEILGSIAVMVVVFFMSILEIPPMSSLSSLSESFELEWELKNLDKPLEIKNEMTLREVSALLPNVTGYDIVKKLEVSGLKVEDIKQSLSELSETNNFPVNEIKRIINSMTNIKTPLQTKAFSNISLNDYSIKNGLDVNVVIEFLEKNEININSKIETISEISKNNLISQAEIQKVLSKIQKNFYTGSSNASTRINTLPDYSGMSIEQISKHLRINKETIFKNLEDNNVSYTDANQTIESISEENKMASSELIKIIDINNELSVDKNNYKRQASNEKLKVAIQGFTLTEVVEKFKENGYDVNIDMIMNRIMQNGISVSGTNQTLKEIAEDNDLTPVQLLDMISGKAGVHENDINPNKKRKIGAGSVNKKLKELPVQYGIKIETILERLKAKGIIANEENTIREISKSSNKSPKEIISIIRDRKPKK